MGVRLWVSGVALAIGLVGSSAFAQERLIHHELDRNTNAIVRVFKTSDGGRIEVETPDLTITKSVAGSRVVTRMHESAPGKDVLMLVLDEKSLSVTTKAGTVKTARTDRERAEVARRMIAGSSVGQRAAALIGRLGLGPATPIQPMLLTTRAFVLAAAGGDDSYRELGRWARAASQRAPSSQGARAIKVGWLEQDKDGASKGMTPTDCWNAYAKEAIAAYMEYEDCMASKSWWDILGQAGCAAIYDMRAIGAMSWWLKCVALN